jgi:hypothetical protein
MVYVEMYNRSHTYRVMVTSQTKNVHRKNSEKKKIILFKMLQVLTLENPVVKIETKLHAPT